MVGYAHARRLERVRPDLSFLTGGLRLPWVTLVFITGFVIEALLAARLWLQMTTADAPTGLQALVISITDVLVSPFRGYESVAISERASGIFEFSTLVAVEAYLIGTLVIVLLIVSTRFLAFSAQQAIATKRRHEARRKSRITLKPSVQVEPQSEVEPQPAVLAKPMPETLVLPVEAPRVEMPGAVTMQTPAEATQ